MQLQKDITSQKRTQSTLEKQIREAHVKANETINKYNVQAVVVSTPLPP